MDVGALVARARSGEPPEATPQHRAEATSPAGAEKGPDVRAGKPVASKDKALDAAASSGRAMKLAIAAVLLVIVTVALLLLLPKIIRDRAMATAREAGFEITIEQVGVSFSGISLRGVKAKAIRIPGVTATMEEIYLAGLSGRNARITGLDARLDGRTTDLQFALGLLLAENRARLAGTPSDPNHLSLVNARLTWDGLTGDGSRLSAGDIGLELDSRGSGAEEARGNVGRFDIVTKAGQRAWGPWASSFERTGTNSRVRLMFDPPVPDGPSALLVWSRLAPADLTIKIPRSPFANLGITPADIGLPADAGTELEAKLHGTFPTNGRSEVTWDATLWAARPHGFSGPIDIHTTGGASGPHDKPLDLEKATVSVGPFVAALTGTVTPHETGARLDVLFKTLPVPCEKLARAEAKTMGPLAATLQDLAHASGALRVTGTVNASGVVKYDTAQPDDASVTWLAKETCGLSVFGL
jgi:hypothetical protein